MKIEVNGITKRDVIKIEERGLDSIEITYKDYTTESVYEVYLVQIINKR